MADVVVTQMDREAALRALGYSEAAISIANDWLKCGGDVYRDEAGSQHGYVDENRVSVAIATARAEGIDEGIDEERKRCLDWANWYRCHDEGDARTMIRVIRNGEYVEDEESDDG